MNLANWLTIAFGLPVVLGVAWQIRRDLRKDKAEQIAAAVEAARREERTENRLRELEDREERDDGDQ